MHELSAQLAAAEQQAAAAQSLAAQLEDSVRDLTAAKALATHQLEEAQHVAEAAKALVLAERQRNADLAAACEAAEHEVAQLSGMLGSAQDEMQAARRAHLEEQARGGPRGTGLGATAWMWAAAPAQARRAAKTIAPISRVAWRPAQPVGCEPAAWLSSLPLPTAPACSTCAWQPRSRWWRRTARCSS